MTSARHRRRLPVRDFAGGVALALLLWWNERRPRKPWSAGPTEVSELAASMARLSWTIERVPLGVSYEDHARGVRIIEAYGNGARAPLV